MEFTINSHLLKIFFFKIMKSCVHIILLDALRIKFKQKKEVLFL